jgi:hypothetical protein
MLFCKAVYGGRLWRPVLILELHVWCSSLLALVLCSFLCVCYYIIVYLLSFASESRRRGLAATGSSLFLIKANDVSFESIFYVCFKTYIHTYIIIHNTYIIHTYFLSRLSSFYNRIIYPKMQKERGTRLKRWLRHHCGCLLVGWKLGSDLGHGTFILLWESLAMCLCLGAVTMC